MAVPKVMSALGLAALIALPGAQPATDRPGTPEDEVVPGAGSLHITLESTEEPLRQGDRVKHKVRVHNSGDEELTEAQVVQFLPPAMRHVSGSPAGKSGDGRVTWNQPLAPGEDAVLRVTAEVTGVPDGADRQVTTVCVRARPDSTLASCASTAHDLNRAVPVVWLVAGLILAVVAAVGAGAFVRYRRTRRPDPVSEPSTAPAPDSAPCPDRASDTASHPEQVPDVGPAPGRAPVYHLDSRR